MKTIADIPHKELPEIFNQASIQLAFGTPAIIEKDYWLVQIMKVLYSDSVFAKNHVFKGGTSLSKCYRLIRRFSEDLDITINRSFLGFNESTADVSGLGSKRRKRFFDDLSFATSSHIEELKENLVVQLNDCLGAKPWSLYLDGNDSQRIIVEYPRLLDKRFYPSQAYVAPRIILELGCRGDTYPRESKNINTYIEQAFPNIFRAEDVLVNTLKAERTFWEKITLLHMLAHQTESKALQPHMARHYYDVVTFYNSPLGEDAIASASLLETVTQHKAAWFRSKQASYDTAKLGSISLVPSAASLSKLMTDYASMNEMFFDEAVPFDDIMFSIRELEVKLNKVV